MAGPALIAGSDQPDRTHPHRPVNDRATRPNWANTAGSGHGGRVDLGVRHSRHLNRHLTASSFKIEHSFDRTAVRFCTTDPRQNRVPRGVSSNRCLISTADRASVEGEDRGWLSPADAEKEGNPSGTEEHR
jgi:hypothetical protein